MATAVVKAPGQGGQAAPAATDTAKLKHTANIQFMTNSRVQAAVCPPASGSGTNLAYTAGSTLLYDVPTADGAYLFKLRIICNINLTFATGTSAVYGLTPSAPFSLFDSIQVVYGQTQASLRPAILRYLAQLSGYQKPVIGSVIAGQTDNTLQSALYGTFAVTTGTNAWNFYFDVPLAAIPHSPAGYLPIQGDSTQCQVKLITTQAGLLGADPLLNPTYAVSGTGNAVTVGSSSTVQVVSMYKDGVHKRGRQPLALDLNGEPTCQYIQDRIPTPLVANLAQRTRLDSKLVHAYILGIVIDGQQSSSFVSARSNITGFGITEDSVGSNKLVGYGNTVANNIPMNSAWDDVRLLIGQDMDIGVIPFVTGPIYGQYNASNGMGSDFLDMTAAGWNDANLELWLGAVGSVCTPRMETFLVSMNSAGLVRAGG